MKVLITGVSGFIGSRLLDAVCERFGATNVLALSSKVNKQCKTIVYRDDFSINKSDLNMLADVELIIHAGAFTPKSRADSNNIEKCNGNITFTQSLLALPFKALKKVVYLSTLDVYGDDKVVSELTELNPETLYGMSKLYCEKMVSSYCDNKSIKGQLLRIGHVYGPGEENYQKLLPIAINNLLNDVDIELWGDGSELRSFIFISDVIKACMASLDLSDDVGVINVVGGHAISIADLLTLLADISSTQLRIVHKPAPKVKKDIIFDNSKMIKHLLKTETLFVNGLKQEIAHVKGKL